MVDEFRLFKASKDRYAPTTNFCKVIPIQNLDPHLRWDIDYLWSPKELSDSGVIDTNVRPCDSLIDEFQDTIEELEKAKDYILDLLTDVTSYKTINVGDPIFFKIYRGNRITLDECKHHPGDIPVVSSGRYESSYLGTISETYLVNE